MSVTRVGGSGVFELSGTANFYPTNKLSLNIKKTNYIIFKKPLWIIPEMKITVKGQEVERVQSTKYLGITIDEHLNCNEHVNTVTPKLKAAAGLIYRLRRTLDRDKLLMLYYAYFHSHMCYLNGIWGANNQNHSQRLAVLQNGVLKTILGVKRRFSTKLTFARIKVMPFDIMAKSSLVVLIYNHMTNKRTLSSPLLRGAQIHGLNTRFASHISIPIIATTHYGSKGLLYIAVKLYNSLPLTIKNAQSTDIFKKKTKEYFMQNFFAS